MFTSVYHPQSNGAVEHANGIFTSIKKRLLDQKKGKWVDELPKLVWSHNTSETRTTKFIPFRLLYGAESMSPEELKNQSLRSTSTPGGNEPSDESDLIELDILQAGSNLSKYQNKTRKWRDNKVVKKDISVGDWVLKQRPNAENIGKMEQKWGGHYLVISSKRPWSYHLADSEGNELPHSWNADSLKKYYI